MGAIILIITLSLFNWFRIIQHPENSSVVKILYIFVVFLQL